MNEASRTKNTLLNLGTSITGQGLSLIMQFLVRTVFIATLGKTYLGISGLLSNLLSMLSIAELGVGSAILYKLYEPILTGNYERISILVKFYRKAYFFIGLVVVTIGCLLIPFLPYLIKDYDSVKALGVNLSFLFLLQITKTVSSYWFFAYKSAIVKADQKEYILTILGFLFNFGAGLLQIAELLVIGSYELFIVISVVSVIGQNLAGAIVAGKLYPFLNQKTDETLSREEAKGILGDCTSLLFYKINNAVYNATDNIVISFFLGIEATGLYANYLLFYGTISTLYSKVFNSVSHSLGNLHAAGNREHEYEVFERVNLITAILAGTAFSGIFVVADEFIETWAGETWAIPQPFSFLLAMELYTLTLRISFAKYRTIMGLFRQSRMRPIASMFINLFVSVLLVQKLGICGVVLGTIIADWSTMLWFDPYIVHRVGFDNQFPLYSYYRKQGIYLLLVMLASFIEFKLCRYLACGHGWFFVVIHSFVCGIGTPLVLLLGTYNQQEGQYLFSLMKEVCAWKRN